MDGCTFAGIFCNVRNCSRKKRVKINMNLSNLAQQGLWETLQGLCFLCWYYSFWKAQMNLKSTI